MGLFDKFKNIFTEEVEEVEVKKEVRQVEIVAPKELEEVKTETEKNDEKFVFPVYFDDKDFEELEPKKEVEVKKELPKKEIYGIKNKEVKVEKKFTPSPVISPVYGILDKNYNKENVVSKSPSRSDYYKPRQNITLEDVRKKAFGTLEDELESSLFSDDPIYTEKEIETSTFSENDDLIDETLKKEDSITTIENKIIDDYKNVDDNSLEKSEDNMTLEALNNLPSEEEDLKITESDLFSLIDSMYEKDDQDGNV